MSSDRLPETVSDLVILTAKIDRLEKGVQSLEGALIEIRVALLGHLDGRPGLLGQMASINADMVHIRNHIAFIDAKIEVHTKELAGVQREGWLMQGKLIGGGGLLGMALSELLKWLTK